MDWLEKALKRYKTQAAFAAELGVNPMTISQWKRRGVPLERAFEIEEKTDGLITRYDTRPDRFDRSKEAAA